MVAMTQTINEKFLSERKAYYSNTFVLMEIVKCLKNKELAFLDKDGKKNIRYLYASKIDYLKMHFEKLGFYDYRVNLYCSVANLSHIPIITYNLKTRRESVKYKEINDNYAKYVLSFDLFFDFDGKEDFKLCHKEAGEFKKILEEMKVPYYLLNSSKKGFHFIIPAIYFDNKQPLKNIEIFREVIYNIKGIYDFKCLDDSISDIKRIRKLPYSVVSDGSIALPLIDGMFENFKESSVIIENVLKYIKLKERGLLTRTYGLSEPQLKLNTAKFCKEFQ